MDTFWKVIHIGFLIWVAAGIEGVFSFNEGINGVVLFGAALRGLTTCEIDCFRGRSNGKKCDGS
eukprot:scaffold158329_cov20-Cyclotella_meneghiniana.AAC.1